MHMETTNHFLRIRRSLNLPRLQKMSVNLTYTANDSSIGKKRLILILNEDAYLKKNIG